MTRSKTQDVMALGPWKPIMVGEQEIQARHDVCTSCVVLTVVPRPSPVNSYDFAYQGKVYPVGGTKPRVMIVASIFAEREGWDVRTHGKAERNAPKAMLYRWEPVYEKGNPNPVRQVRHDATARTRLSVYGNDVDGWFFSLDNVAYYGGTTVVAAKIAGVKRARKHGWRLNSLQCPNVKAKVALKKKRRSCATLEEVTALAKQLAVTSAQVSRAAAAFLHAAEKSHSNKAKAHFGQCRKLASDVNTLIRTTDDELRRYFDSRVK